MDKAAIVERIVRNLSFEVVGIPQGVPLAIPPKSTLLNVKIKARKKGDVELPNGVSFLSKLDKKQCVLPGEMHLASSDQTITSFDAVIKDENKHDLEIILPDAAYKAEAATSSGINSHRATKNRFTLSKDKIETSPILSKRNKDIFGICKPGGCLDPPFGEDKYSYRPSKKSALQVKTSIVRYPSDSNKLRSSSIFKNALLKKKKYESKDDNCKKMDIDNKYKAGSVLNLHKTEPILATNSTAIITYPHNSDYNELDIQERRQMKIKSLDIERSNAANYFIVPKRNKNLPEKVDVQPKNDIFIKDDKENNFGDGNYRHSSKSSSLKELTVFTTADIDPLSLPLPIISTPSNSPQEKSFLDIPKTDGLNSPTKSVNSGTETRIDQSPPISLRLEKEKKLCQITESRKYTEYFQILLPLITTPDNNSVREDGKFVEIPKNTQNLLHENVPGNDGSKIILQLFPPISFEKNNCTPQRTELNSSIANGVPKSLSLITTVENVGQKIGERRFVEPEMKARNLLNENVPSKSICENITHQSTDIMINNENNQIPFTPICTLSNCIQKDECLVEMSKIMEKLLSNEKVPIEKEKFLGQSIKIRNGTENNCTPQRIELNSNIANGVPKSFSLITTVENFAQKNGGKKFLEPEMKAHSLLNENVPSKSICENITHQSTDTMINNENNQIAFTSICNLSNCIQKDERLVEMSKITEPFLSNEKVPIEKEKFLGQGIKIRNSTENNFMSPLSTMSTLTNSTPEGFSEMIMVKLKKVSHENNPENGGLKTKLELANVLIAEKKEEDEGIELKKNNDNRLLLVKDTTSFSVRNEEILIENNQTVNLNNNDGYRSSIAQLLLYSSMPNENYITNTSVDSDTILQFKKLETPSNKENSPFNNNSLKGHHNTSTDTTVLFGPAIDLVKGDFINSHYKDSSNSTSSQDYVIEKDSCDSLENGSKMSASQIYKHYTESYNTEPAHIIISGNGNSPIVSTIDSLNNIQKEDDIKIKLQEIHTDEMGVKSEILYKSSQGQTNQNTDMITKKKTSDTVFSNIIDKNKEVLNDVISINQLENQLQSDIKKHDSKNYINNYELLKEDLIKPIQISDVRDHQANGDDISNFRLDGRICDNLTKNVYNALSSNKINTTINDNIAKALVIEGSKLSLFQDSVAENDFNYTVNEYHYNKSTVDVISINQDKKIITPKDLLTLSSHTREKEDSNNELLNPNDNSSLQSYVDSILCKHDSNNMNNTPIGSSSMIKEVDYWKLDLALHSYIDDNSLRVLKTFDSQNMPEQFQSNALIVAKCTTGNREIKIPVDKKYELNIQIKSKEPITHLDIMADDLQKDNNIGITVPDDIAENAYYGNANKPEMSKNNNVIVINDNHNIHDALVSIYDQELVPLKNVMKELREEIDFLIACRATMKEKYARKRLKSARMVRGYRKCGCSRKII